MGTSERNITSLDYLRLINLITNDVGQSAVPAENLHQLYLVLETSHKVKSEEIPDNIVTMNSDVVIKYMQSGITKTIRIVYPTDNVPSGKNIGSDDKITIYNPLAISMLGLKEHDICISRRGIIEEPVMIDKVIFQPEAHKIFSL
jgi:regulator of nucleoside diphosphate kinase